MLFETQIVKVTMSKTSSLKSLFFVIVLLMFVLVLLNIYSPMFLKKIEKRFD